MLKVIHFFLKLVRKELLVTIKVIYKFNSKAFLKIGYTELIAIFLKNQVIHYYIYFFIQNYFF